MNTNAKSMLPVFGLLAALNASSTSIRADYSFAVLHSFRPGLTDGSGPEAPVAIDGNTVFGTTAVWGSGQDGVLFSMDLSGSNYAILHNFTGTDGDQPRGGAIKIGDEIIGTATFGGLGSAAGNGLVFTYNTATADFQIRHLFAGAFTDGANPQTALTVFAGRVYGTTFGGGTFGNGTIFSVDAAGSNYVLEKSFRASGGNGGVLQSPLLPIGNKLYGTTNAGGAFQKGTIFSFDPATAAVTFLHSFTGGAADGANPAGNLAVVGNVLYGTTFNGGALDNGAAYGYDLSTGIVSLLHSFGGGTTDGADPRGGVTAVGSKVFGTTDLGGPSNRGTIFAFDVELHSYQIIHSFTGSAKDGSRPFSSLTLAGTNLYGTTFFGGTFGGGTVYSIAVPEPGTLALALTGVVLMLAKAKRRHAPHPRFFPFRP